MSTLKDKDDKNQRVVECKGQEFLNGFRMCQWKGTIYLFCGRLHNLGPTAENTLVLAECMEQRTANNVETGFSYDISSFRFSFCGCTGQQMSKGTTLTSFFWCTSVNTSVQAED